MPADLRSTILVILLAGADAVARLWPYVVGGIAVAVLLSYAVRGRQGVVLPWAPGHLSTPLAALAGAASPLPTTGAVPLVLRLRAGGLPAGPALAFVLASSLMNPQLFVLTLGALGPAFALAQVGAVLLLSTGLALAFGGLGTGRGQQVPVPGEWTRLDPGVQARELAGHVGLYFLVGVLVGASFQVLLPQSGILDWLGARGWLASPLLGWLGAPFYTCGGSAIPLARSLGQTGFSPGTLFTFLLVGPALRGTTLANLGCLLPRRLQAACLAALLLAGGLLGLGFDRLVGGIV
jgi:uncharacterized membrane protein YraQ (UPF0718 family)